MAYDEQWAYEFIKIRDFYNRIFKDLSFKVKVVHVGSTSVTGLSAKPILDIDLIIDHVENKQVVIDVLEANGYKHEGNLGLKGREAFSYELSKLPEDFMAHHLYLCHKDNIHYKNHVKLKKHLAENKEAVKAYSALKIQLAEKYPYDIEAYIQGKSGLIRGFLENEGFASQDLNQIESLNKSENK